MARGRPSVPPHLKRLLLRSGGQCAYPGCEVALSDPTSDSIVGEMAHIRGRRAGAARHDPDYATSQIDDEKNLLMLCRNHHKIVDDDPVRYTTETLESMKGEHEHDVRIRLVQSDDEDQYSARLRELIREELRLHQEADESTRPAFERTDGAMSGLEAKFQPQWRLKQVDGTDYVRNLEWRFRGPRFQMEWRQASGASLDRTHIVESFDLSQEPSEVDELVALNELALEIRFHWRGRWRHETHRWPISRRETDQGKVLWDVGGEVLPPIEWDE